MFPFHGKTRNATGFIKITIELIDRYLENVAISVSEYKPMNIFHADID